MKKSQLKSLTLFIVIFFLSGCAGQSELTKQQVIIQQKATNALTEILFEHDLDENTSYEVNKDGYVHLRVQGLVSIKIYTKAIEELRAHSNISGVRAEQGGIEICPATIIVR